MNFSVRSGPLQLTAYMYVPVQRNNTSNIHFLFLIHISDVRDRSAAMLTSSGVVSNLEKFMFIKYIILRKTNLRVL